jgi:NADPH2:quinone reductase
MLAAAGHSRANVVFDPVGGDRLEESARVLAPEGRLISVGFTGGIPKVSVNRLLVRNLTLIGADWPPDSPVTSERLIPWVVAQLGAGALKPPVTHMAPLRDAANVLTALAEGKLKGKAVLELESKEG